MAEHSNHSFRRSGGCVMPPGRQAARRASPTGGRYVRWPREITARSSLLAAVALLLVVSCGSDKATTPRPLTADDVIGLWAGTGIIPGDRLRIERNTGGSGYIGTEVAANDSCAVGQVSIEFVADSTGPGFVGRHLWCNADTSYWGADRMVRVEQPDRDHLWIRFLDHVNQGGWHYERASE